MDAKGKVIGSPRGRSLEAFTIAGDALPTPASSPALLAMRRDLAAAREHADSERFADAAAAYGRVLSAKLSGEPKPAARKELAALETRAQERIVHARELEARDPMMAAKTLRELARAFSGLDAASSASRLAATIEESGAYQSADSDASLALEISKARSLLSDGKVARAHEILVAAIERHGRHGKPGEVRTEAMETLRGMENDPKLMEAVTEGQAERVIGRAMKTARNYALNKRSEKAISKLRDAIAQFPDTSWADRAQKLIEDIRAGKVK